MENKQAISKVVKVKGFIADAVIGNYLASNVTMMFKLDAKDVIKVVSDYYTICGHPIRTVDSDYEDIYIRGYYAYGKVRKGKKELHGKHLFNIDMVVTVNGNTYSTPIRYFYENTQEVGDAICMQWLNKVFGGDPISPSKPQIKKVLQWVDEISSNSKYTNAPLFELEKKASSYIVRKALDILTDSKCIDKQTIKDVVVYSITNKGKQALN